jgi:hypothetical protein
MKKRLVAFKNSVEANTKFCALDFTWGYRKAINGNHRILWALLLRGNVYADCIDIEEGDLIASSINTLEKQAIATYENLRFFSMHPGYLIPHTVDSNGNTNHNVSADVKLGDVEDLDVKLAELWPDAILFDTKEELLEHLKTLS